MKLTTVKLMEDSDRHYLREAAQFQRERENGSDLSNEDHLEAIAKEIRARSNSLRHQIYQIGRLLYEARERLPHGKFGPWVEENFEFSRSTVTNFLRVYKCCLGCPELVEHFAPTTLYKMCAPSFPKDFRKLLFENSAGVYDVIQRELLEIAHKWKKGKVNLKSKEVQALLKKRSVSSLKETILPRVKNVRDQIRRELQTIERLIRSHQMEPIIRDKEFFDLDKYADEEEPIDPELLKFVHLKEKFDDFIVGLGSFVNKCKAKS